MLRRNATTIAPSDRRLDFDSESKTTFRAERSAGAAPRADLGSLVVRWDSHPLRVVLEQAERIRWRGNVALVDRLMSELSATDFSNRVTPVKSGTYRCVYRIRLSSQAVYLKHFKATDSRAVIRNVFLGTPAEREARGVELVKRAGIDTLSWEAAGAVRRGPFARDSFLITREIAGTRPLDELLAEKQSVAGAEAVRFRQELSRGLGRLVGRLHGAGLTHDDLHPGNLLARMDPDGGCSLWLIDLQRVHRWPAMTFRRARGELFALFKFFHWMSERSDQHRFFRAYWEQMTAAKSNLSLRSAADRGRSLARRIDDYFRRALPGALGRHDRKWQRSHRRLIVADRGVQRCRGLASLGKRRIENWRDQPNSLFAADVVTVWHRQAAGCRHAIVNLPSGDASHSSEVREITRRIGLAERVFGGSWSETRRAWEMAHALLRRGFPAVRPLFYTESRDQGVVREFLLSEQPAGQVPLTVFLERHLPLLPPRERERWISAITRRLAIELRKMRSFGLVQKEITAAGLLVPIQATDRSIQFANTGSLFKLRRPAHPCVIRGLLPLYATVNEILGLRRAQILRFLRAYLGEAYRAEWKAVWSMMFAQSSGKHRRDVKRPARKPSGFRSPALFLAILASTVLLGGCQAIDRPVALPVRHSVRSDQLLVLSDFRLPKDHELIRELNTLREQVGHTLDLPLQRDPVIVYLFKDENEYRKYMIGAFPKLPPRSAYFVDNGTELAVYTHWGTSVREDLRHEYTHGLLHSVMRKIPLWLDEGLAEYFEVTGPRPGSVNRDYARRLTESLANGWRPNLKRLEALDEAAPMKRADYQESWGWVHFLLNSTPESKQVLLSYLKDLRTPTTPMPISQRLREDVPGFEERFASYIGQLQSSTRTVGAL
jgi:hypothetical protein